MSLSEVFGTTVLKFKADTSDLRTKLRDVTNDQKKLTQEINLQGKAWEASGNKALDWGKGLERTMGRVSAGWETALGKVDKVSNVLEKGFRGLNDVAEHLGISLPPVFKHLQQIVGGVGDLADALSRVPFNKLKALLGTAGVVGAAGVAAYAAGSSGGSLADRAGLPTEAGILAGLSAVALPGGAVMLYAADKITGGTVSGELDAFGNNLGTRAGKVRAPGRLDRSGLEETTYAGFGGFVEEAKALDELRKKKHRGGRSELEYFVDTRSGLVPVFSSDIGGGDIRPRIAGALGAIDSPKVGTSALYAGSPTFDNAAFQKKQLELQAQAGIEAGKATWLESAFGTIEDINAYSVAFEALSGVLQTAFDAWASGADLTAESMKGLAANAIRGVASLMFAEALKHGAYALGNLAFGLSGDPRAFAAAAAHGKAAAAFGAGAVLVGGLSRALSPSGGPSVGATGGHAPSVGGAAGSGGGGGNITIIYGSSDADESPRWRQQKLWRDIERARRFQSGSNTVIRG